MKENCKMSGTVREGDFEKRRGILLEMLRRCGEIVGRTRIQKLVFLGQEELGLPHLFEFSKNYYGPYSRDLTDTLERLISQGDVIEEISESGDQIQYTYRPSDIASDKTGMDVPDESFDVIKRLSEIPLGVMLDYVYRKYLPESACS